MYTMFACFSKPKIRLLRTLLYNFSGKDPGHIYIIKEREFIKTKEPIYKIGKTKNIKNRMPSYPKDSRVYVMYYTDDIHTMEKDLIKTFDRLFIKRTDIGHEYYETKEDIVYHFFLKIFEDHIIHSI